MLTEGGNISQHYMDFHRTTYVREHEQVNLSTCDSGNVPHVWDLHVMLKFSVVAQCRTGHITYFVCYNYSTLSWETCFSHNARHTLTDTSTQTLTAQSELKEASSSV